MLVGRRRSKEIGGGYGGGAALVAKRISFKDSRKNIKNFVLFSKFSDGLFSVVDRKLHENKQQIIAADNSALTNCWRRRPAHSCIWYCLGRNYFSLVYFSVLFSYCRFWQWFIAAFVRD